MGYYERKDLPFHFSLADNFTICDNYYRGVLGPTYPNRIIHLSGTIDPGGEHGGPIIDNGAPYGVCDWECYPTSLENAGVSWRYYQDNQDFNYMGFFPEYYTAAVGSKLYDLGMATHAHKFEYDAMTGNLPAVSWIATTSVGSEHPNASPAAARTSWPASSTRWPRTGKPGSRPSSSSTTTSTTGSSTMARRLPLRPGLRTRS